MAVRVEVMSGRKGSNPGGKCKIITAKGPFIAYVKHCIGAKNMGDSNFVAAHQPIYEAVTTEMARRLGLAVPNFFGLLNKNKDVVFSFDNGFDNEIYPDRPCYFVSELIDIFTEEDKTKTDLAITNEAIYRNLLQVADIVGKKQNYFFSNIYGKLFYLDLGCSFVHATDGYMQLKQSHSSPLDNKEFRTAIKYLRKFHLICNDNSSLIRLDDLVFMPSEISVPTLNPPYKSSLDSLISGAEIEEISGRLAAGLMKVLRKNKDSPLLIK